MALSHAAALLDELMGRSRNDGSTLSKQKKVHWDDPEVIFYRFIYVDVINETGENATQVTP